MGNVKVVELIVPAVLLLVVLALETREFAFVVSPFVSILKHKHVHCQIGIQKTSLKIHTRFSNTP